MNLFLSRPPSQRPRHMNGVRMVVATYWSIDDCSLRVEALPAARSWTKLFNPALADARTMAWAPEAADTITMHGFAETTSWT